MNPGQVDIINKILTMTQDELAALSKYLDSNKPGEREVPVTTFPQGPFIELVHPSQVPPHVKEQLIKKLGLDSGEKRTYTPVNNDDIVITNNLVNWLASSGQDGVTAVGDPVIVSTLDDRSRQRANDVFVKMMDRIEKQIELKNDGTI